MINNKKGVLPILAILLLISGVAVIGIFLGVLDTGSITGDYTKVYKQFYGTVCCEEGALEPAFVRYTDDYNKFKCDAYTDECRITLIDNGGGELLADIDFVWKLDGSQQSIKRNQVNGYEIILPYGKTIEFLDKSSFIEKDNRQYIQFSEQHRRFGLVGQENGATYTTTSCILNSNLRERVSMDGLNELSRTGSNRCQNYVTDFVEVATKTYSYSGKEVVCQARNLYDIDVETFKDGSSRKIQGQRIKSVDCCPTESGCTENFKFSSVNIRECSIDSECANGGLPISFTGTSYITFGCENGICKQSTPQTVECTNNAICQNKFNDPQKVCKNFKCSDDEQWLGHCGDGSCENVIGETPTSCPQDCGTYKEPINWLFWIILIIILVVLVFFYKQVWAYFRAFWNATIGRIGLRI